jgi:hypothetical protein
LISRNPGVGIGIAIEISSDSDLDTDRDEHKLSLHSLFLRLGAPPAHGSLFPPVMPVEMPYPAD